MGDDERVQPEQGEREARSAAVGRVLREWGAGAVRRWKELARARASRRIASASIPRSTLEVAVEARLAVRAGVRLEDFLRQRLAKYAVRLPVPLEDLPVSIDVEGGEPVIRSRSTSTRIIQALAPRPRPEEPARWMRALAEREGPFAVQRIGELQAEIAEAEARVAAARDRAEAVAHELEEDLRTGAVPALAHVDATPEQKGRPPVPPIAPIAALHALVVALVAAEAWFFAGPILDANGVSAEDLLENLAASPVPVAMSLLLSAGAAVSVLAFAAVAIARGADLVGSATPVRRRQLGVLASGGAALVAAGVALAALTPGRPARLAVVVALPFAAGVVLRLAFAMRRARDAAQAAALAWDRMLAQKVSERARRDEIVERAQQALRRAEHVLAASRERLRALEREAIDADDAEAERARAEARRLDRLGESIAAALELDRYAFLRVAAEAAGEALATPIRRLDPATAREPRAFR